jgi:hypothetical protein
MTDFPKVKRLFIVDHKIRQIKYIIIVASDRYTSYKLPQLMKILNYYLSCIDIKLGPHERELERRQAVLFSLWTQGKVAI